MQEKNILYIFDNAISKLSLTSPIRIFLTGLLIDLLLTISIFRAPGQNNKREKKVTMMVYLMILAFLIAWLPYAILALAVQYFYVSIPNHEKFSIRKQSLQADLINLSIMFDN